MPPYYYHLKFELYATPDPTATTAGNSPSTTTRDDIWVPPPGASIFDDLPAHPRSRRQQQQQQQERPTTTAKPKPAPKQKPAQRWAQWGVHYDDDDDVGRGSGGGGNDRRRESAYAAAAGNTRVIDCGTQRGRAHDTAAFADPAAPSAVDARGGLAVGGGVNAGFGTSSTTTTATASYSPGVLRRGERLQRTERSPPPTVADGIGPGKAATPAASLGPNLGGMGLATKASYMSPSDFLGFIGEKWRGYVSHYRMVMTSRMNRYMVLMKFWDYRRAREWKKEFDGKPFDSVETEICHVTFIKSITVETPSQTSTQRKHSEGSNDRFSPTSPMANSLKPFPPPTPNLLELPTCATWKGSGCPVCRATNPKPNHEHYDPNNPYSQPFGSGVANICNNCNCTDDLWICLICGNVGCGRYNGGHAKEHWKRTAHSFSLELETQHVWDYAGDMWVHRLIRDKGDGKIVELPRNNNTNDQRQYGAGPPGGTAQEDVVPRAKLDNIGMEYTHLLTSQLESQRVYFEEMVNKAADKAAKASAAAESASAQATEALRQLAALRDEHRVLKDETVPSLEREVAREKTRAAKSAELARSLGKALQEEKEVSAGLMKRIEHLKGEAEGTAQAVEQLKAENEELKEMNRDLTMFISGQEKLRELEKEGLVGEGELEDGTSLIVIRWP
ncbi:hypothetical protein NEMBOFW57_008475 [Staphylotrichum longicolle]|uniref:UBP-type domain-containing protein n=1 Tax=Staphylotrichum longicolle TaxID=669026 RepID=A0AAD4HX87_9PEZI|nr:hypothetical protein NEMBOFW57_008475 [Staphylotrichum longicolle]